MIEYFKWIVNPDNINANIFTLISVIASGIISWAISAIYFHKGNRDNLRVAVLYPMRRLLEDSLSYNNYLTLMEYTKDYSMKYLKCTECSIIDKLLSAYKDVCSYNYESVCAEDLFSYFKEKLKENGIKYSTYPLSIGGEVVDVVPPPEMLDLRENIKSVIEQHPPAFDTENCKNKVSELFNWYCKKHCDGQKVIFFDDGSIQDILNKGKKQREWNDKYERYQVSKEEFLNMKVLK